MQINKATARELYKLMLKIRLTEEAIAERYSEWKMRCPTHLSIGQEGVAAGVCHALDTKDFALSTHRAHAHYLAKGGDLHKMIAEIYGKETGCTSGKGGSMHLIDKRVGFMGSTSIVGNTVPLAVGLGLSIQLKGTDQICCVFFGDAAVEEGTIFESINFAVLKKLPVLFICENNLYSVYSPLKVRQPENRNIYEMFRGLGITTDHGDGNNAVEVYLKTKQAIEHIRQGKGPVFIEFSTYRWREHCGPNYDNDLGYRTEDEFLSWKKRDPVKRLENDLLNGSLLSRDEVNALKASIRGDVNEAFEFAEQSPFPHVDEAFTNLYSAKGAK